MDLSLHLNLLFNLKDGLLYRNLLFSLQAFLTGQAALLMAKSMGSALVHDLLAVWP